MIIEPFMMPPSMLVFSPAPPLTVITSSASSVLSNVTPVVNPYLWINVFIFPPMITTVYSLTHTIIQLAGLVCLGIHL